jgi:hypothetical protein
VEGWVRRGEVFGVGVDFGVVVDGVAQVIVQLGEEAGVDEGLWSCVDSRFALRGVRGAAVISEREGCTWPPEKPTATTPRCVFSDSGRYLGTMEVIAGAECADNRSSG